MWLPDWMLKIIGKQIAKKLKLEDGKMETKKWYVSKGVWTGILTVLIGGYETTRVAVAPQFGWNIPAIPPFVYTLLGAMGVYTRVTAETKIG